MLRVQSRKDSRRRLGLGVATAAALLAVAAPAASAAPFAYVTNSYPVDEVAQFNIGPGGLLAPLSPFTVATRQHPISVAFSPDGESVYVGNSGALSGDPDDEQGSISQYDVAADGELSPKSPASVISCGSTAGPIAVSPDGQSLYAPTGSDCTRIYQYDIDPGGELSPKSPAFADVDDNADPYGVVVSPDGQSVYVASSRRVYQYDVGSGGELSPKSPPWLATANQSFEVAVTPDGRSVYVTIQYGNSIAQYDVGASGELSPKSPPRVATGGQPRHLAVSPDGKSAYVANGATDNVSQYDIDPVSGELSAKSPATVAAGDVPNGIEVSPDGDSVYVTNYGFFQSGNVSQYDVGSGGELSPKRPATIAAGFHPTGIAVSQSTRVPTTKEQCKHGGWREFGFKSKRKCIRFLKRQARQSCRAERDSIGRQAFREKYGKGKHHRRAMRRCVKQAIRAG
jgi:6-phosphogluconolactonase (cycloisomerase 2 family)